MAEQIERYVTARIIELETTGNHVQDILTRVVKSYDAMAEDIASATFEHGCASCAKLRIQAKVATARAKSLQSQLDSIQVMAREYCIAQGWIAKLADMTREE